MKKVTLVILGLSVAVLLGVYLMLGSIIRSSVEAIVPSVTGTGVALEDVDISVFSGRARLNGFVIDNPEEFKSESAFKVGKVAVDIDVSTILDDVIRVESILIDGAEITWEGWAGDNHKKIMENVDKYSASDEKEKKETEPEEPSKSEKKVIIEDFKFQNSNIKFVLGGSEVAELSFPDLHLTDIGKEEGGQSIGETVKQNYNQIFASMSSSVTENKDMLNKKVMELSKETGKSLKEGTEKIVEGIKEIGDIFKKE
jgi:uncharacterized protein involved in outer membrane biogenesis